MGKSYKRGLVRRWKGFQGNLGNVVVYELF